MKGQDKPTKRSAASQHVCHFPRREQRRSEAAIRQAARDKRSPAAQLAELLVRQDGTAAREVARLEVAA